MTCYDNNPVTQSVPSIALWVQRVAYTSPRLLLTLCFTTVLAACGGGGGGAAPSTDTTPTPTNNAPSFTVDSTQSIDENATEVVTVTASDADGDSVSFSLTGGSDLNAFTLSGTAVLAFTSAPDFEQPNDADTNNVYEVEITASDGQDSTRRLFQIQVNDVAEVTNAAPTAFNNANRVVEDGTATISGNVISDNDGAGVDTDPDGDGLTLTELSGGDNYGTLSYTSSGSYSYTLNNSLDAVQALNGGETLTETYEYRVSDGELSSNVATLIITIEGRDESDDITLGFYQPSTTSVLVSNEFSPVITLSSVYEISQVTATIGSLSIQLGYSADVGCSRNSCTGGFTGTFDLSALSSGDYELFIKATDTRGVSNTIRRDITLDRGPTLQVGSPIALSVIRGQLTADVSCTDTEGDCTLSVAVDCSYFSSQTLCPDPLSATNSVTGTLNLSALDGATVGITVTAEDSAGQTVTETRQVIVETSAQIEPFAAVPGKIIDFDADRILYTASGEYVIRNMASSTDTRIDLPANLSLYEGFLTPTGAVLSLTSDTTTSAQLYDFNDGALYELGKPNSTFSGVGAGNYLIFNTNGDGGSGKRLIRRDLAAKTNVVISDNAGNTQNDVNATGNVVYWDRNYHVRLSNGSSDTLVASDPNLWATYPLIGGSAVVYRLHDPCCSEQRYSIRLNQNGADTLLSDFRLAEPSPGRDYQTTDGWVAYTREGTAGQSQVWVQSTSGQASQRSSFGTDSTIKSLADDGDLAFINGGDVYLSSVTSQFMATDVSAGQVATMRKLSGKWYLSMGRELFVVPEW
jgi:VCBS repeat-containing protein